MLRLSSSILLIFIFALLFGVSVADVPRVMNYQGQMTDPSGLPLDTTIQMVFTIYDDSTGNNIIWTETQGSVEVVDGQFSVMLGSINSLNDDVFSAVDRFLGITIGSDSEIDPRTRLGTVPYSIRSSTIDGALGGTIEGPVEIVASKDRAVGLTVVGDLEVTASATIGTNLSNSGNYNFIAGQSNEINGSQSTIAGGSGNTVTHHYSTISGGQSNTAEWNWSTIGGGRSNSVTSQYGTISGGAYNQTSNGTVSGGRDNNAGQSAAVGGGYNNTSTAIYSSIMGGRENDNNGDYSAIPGGYADTITSSADYSYLFGIQSKLTEDSTFMVDMPHIRFGDEATGYEFPEEDGTSGQVMVTDGSGQLNWTTVSGGSSSGWVDDGTNVRLETSSDFVGIGTATPSEKLDVEGNAEISGSLTLGSASTAGVLTTLSTSGTNLLNVGYNLSQPDQARMYLYDGSTANIALWGDGQIQCKQIGVGSGVTPGSHAIKVESSNSGTNGSTLHLMNTHSSGIALVCQTTASSDLPLLITQQGSGDLFRADSWPGGVWTPQFTIENDGTTLIPNGRLGIGDGASFPQGLIDASYTSSGVERRAKGVYSNAKPSDPDCGSVTPYLRYGLFGWVEGDDFCTASENIGVYGMAKCHGGMNIGVLGSAFNCGAGGTVWTGYFTGNVYVGGTVSYAKNTIKIDHPLDPENMNLYHNGVNSPDMKNVYDGTVILDESGNAEVVLPDYFEALNEDFRYQLTAIGAPGPNLYVSEEISNNRFRISGGKSGMKVSWQVTGIRADNYAKAHDTEIEEFKSLQEQGKYIHAEEMGYSIENDVDYKYMTDDSQNEMTAYGK